MINTNYKTGEAMDVGATVGRVGQAKGRAGPPGRTGLKGKEELLTANPR